MGTTGGNGTIAWTVSDDTIANITNGLLKITGVGSVTVTATSTKPGYADQTATWAFYAEKKPVMVRGVWSAGRISKSAVFLPSVPSNV